ncbi:hypothetical protein Pla8534_01640 [Lignipirellula cremea]|uniref:Sulfatase n=2 Tax=Lignipirellula cremea TaxID=2528010 RepID=A0A518DKR2_9BACT|nr:hypothetical protein Pla8534_01640 [Lignipirellula cremea]
MDPYWARLQQHGESGLRVSQWLPNLARHADSLCVLRAMHTDTPIDSKGTLLLHCGHWVLPLPSLGSWVLYGLGCENENMPSYIALNMSSSFGGIRNCGSAFLPSTYQGVGIGQARQAVEPSDGSNLTNDSISPNEQQRQIQLVERLNQRFLEQTASPEIEGMIQSHETTFRMQMDFSQQMDFTSEPQRVLDVYGAENREQRKVRWGRQTSVDVFARQCLLARPFAEAGVRFIELNMEYWDTHTTHRRDTQNLCWAVDQPIASLFDDLKQCGLWDDTLVVWGGEFGRTTSEEENQDGTDHNPRGYTMFLAGGGVQGCFAYGRRALDVQGTFAVEGKVHVHDLHATIVHLLGLDHERLTYRYSGRDFRLTDVFGRVVNEIIV